MWTAYDFDILDVNIPYKKVNFLSLAIYFTPQKSLRAVHTFDLNLAIYLVPLVVSWQSIAP